MRILTPERQDTLIPCKMDRAHFIKIRIANALKMLILGAVLVCVLFLVGCAPVVGSWKYEQEKRIVSPDGQIEAVIMTGDAGATTARTTFVCIVSKGEQIETNRPIDSEAIFRADHIKGLDVRWKENHLLIIQYDEARIAEFNNLWDILKNRKYAYPVEIRLAPTSPDYSVPAGDRTSFFIQ